jgi:hypothetical protein
MAVAEIVPVILEWRRDCATTHKHCHRSQPSRAWPTRLIDIGDSSSTQAPFLREMKEHPKVFGDYIALSHCWGKSQIITTTKATYIERTKAIPWSSLSKTFQDAIVLARALGVRYIWIDSLAIIQDDSNDWAREASRMASVYQNSWLSIAATAASNGNDGFLLPRPIYGIDGEENGHPYRVLVRENIDHSPFSQRAQMSNPSTKRRLPLLSRGWTLQEQLLAPCIIHFTEQELVWECNEGFVCECKAYPHVHDGLKKDIAQACQGNGKQSLAWQDLLEEYSCRQLTYDKDLLPALSGISSQFSELGRYLAGHWEKDLPFSLLWKVSPGKRSWVPEVGDTALCSPPSWSWTSIGSEGKEWIPTFPWEEDIRESKVSILEASCSPTTPDPRGTVSGGQITLRGRLLTLQIHSIFYTGRYADFWWHLRFPEEITEGNVEIAAEDVCAFVPDLPLDVFAKKNSRESIYFLQLTRNAKDTIHGLLLLEEPQSPYAISASRTCTRSGLVCRRIGIAHLTRRLDMELYAERIVTVV